MEQEKRIAELERKVDYLEQQLELLSRRSPSPIKNYQLETYQQRGTVEGKELKKKEVVPTDWEHLIARVWLPRIFIVVFLLGVLWGFMAAVNAGIITEPIRCIIGLVVAGLMYWQGEAQIRQKRSALGQVLLGGAIGVLILSLFAAHMLFDLIPANPAFILFIASIGISVYTSVRHRSEALMIITLITGYFIPFLVNSTDADYWIFAGYEGLFSIAMIIMSVRYSFRAAYYVAIGVLHIPLLAVLADGDVTESRLPIITVVFLQHILLYIIATFRSEESQKQFPISLYLSFGIITAWMYGLYGFDSSSAHQLIYKWLIASWATIYSITALWLFSHKKALSVHLSIATLGWFLWLVYALHLEQATSVILVEGVIAISLGIKLRSKLQQITGAAVYLIGLIQVLLHPINEIISLESLAWIILLLSIVFLYRYSKHALEDSAGRKEWLLLLLWSGAILFLVFLTEFTNALTKGLSFDYQHLILSAVWILYAIAVIVIGLLIKKAKARVAGILFLFVTLLKIVFFDLPDVSTPIRAVLFIGLGAIGVAISRVFYKRKS